MVAPILIGSPAVTAVFAASNFTVKILCPLNSILQSLLGYAPSSASAVGSTSQSFGSAAANPIGSSPAAHAVADVMKELLK